MRPCLDCGTLMVLRRTRCKACQRLQDRRHNAAPQRVAYRDPEYTSVPLSGFCVQCGAVDDLTRDHIVPLVQGGTNERSNIRLLCRSCNSGR